MKNPLDGMTSTVVCGVILTILLALIVGLIPNGVLVALVVIILVWLWMFSQVSKALK